MTPHDRATGLDFLLVNMPSMDVQCPALPLGLLKAILQRDGIRTRVLYPSLLFLEHLPPELTMMFYRGKKAFIGEWIFGRRVFPEQERKFSEYADFLLADKERQYWEHVTKEDVVAKLNELVAYAEAFVDRTAAAILEMRPRMVGCTSCFYQHLPALALLRRLRELDPDVVSLMGGPSCETERGVTTHRLFPWVDYVVSGEADDLISDLAGNILSRGRDVEGADLAEGVFAPVHRRTGYPVTAGGGVPRAVTRSLEGLPVPDYDEYFETLESTPTLKSILKPGIPIETARGCWWAEKTPCTFCGINTVGCEYRSKSGKKVLAELDALAERYQTRRFVCTDDTLDMSYYDTLLPELAKRGSPYLLFFEVTSRLNRGQVEKLAKAGAMWIQPGIESFNSEILTLMRKGCHAWQNIQILKWAREFGVWVTYNILYGFPGERDECYQEMARLIPLLTHLNPPLRAGSIYFQRNSVYFREAEKYGLRLKPSAEYYHYLPLPEEDVYNMAVAFSDEASADRKNDAMEFLFHYGRRAVARESKKWKTLFESPDRPVLLVERSSDGLTITDTRPVAVRKTTVLTGVDADLYLECDEAPSRSVVTAKLAEQGYDPAEIEGAIERLRAAKILIEIDRRLISLAVRQSESAPRPRWFNCLPNEFARIHEGLPGDWRDKA